jgi:citrate lyase subunit beta/citryl-CoA lyase
MTVGRTLLFVPADRPDRVAKALASAADSVAVDLEDAIAERSKEVARGKARQAIAAAGPSGPRLFLRINGLDTPWADGDLAVVAETLRDGGRLDGLLLPKAGSAEQLHRVSEVLEKAERDAGSPPGAVSLAPIVETAAGVLDAPAIASAGPRVCALVCGTLDLAGQLGVTPSVAGRELLHVRSRLVLACAAAGLPGPMDGPHPSIDDDEGLRESSLASRELGFSGRAVLHPRQLPIVRAAFTPSDAELARAREVLDAYRRASADGVGAVRLADGTFVDRPVVLRAAALLGDDEAVLP